MMVRAFALALALSGLTAGRAGAAADPCADVSKADAAKALGTPVTAVKFTTVGPSRNCSFHGPGPLQSVLVTVFPWGPSARAHERFGDLVKQTASAFAATPARLSGVGDEAVTINSNVYARKGGNGYVFNVFGRRTAALTARSVALAKSTLARAR